MAIRRMVAGGMGMATVLVMAATREAGTMPFRSTDADHTDIKMDTDTATDMTRDTGIWVTRGGIRTPTHIRRILPTTTILIRRGRTRPTALVYSGPMVGSVSGRPGKLWPGEP